MRPTTPLIIGAGPAGSAAAITLARAGERPVVLERQAQTPDHLCGGFVSWRTLQTLERLGIAADALNPVSIVRARLFAGGRMAEAALPGPARAVSRQRLDGLLNQRAMAEGAAIQRGIAVRRIVARQVTLADGATLDPQCLFLATGKHDVRGSPRDAGADTDPTLGLRVRLPIGAALAATLADSIELHLFDRGYAGVVMQEDGMINLCLAVHRSRMAESGGPGALLQSLAAEFPRLGDRLAALDARTPVDAVANVPYGWRARHGAAGLFRLGDQAAVIPSLAGEGIGIALASGVAGARAWLRGGPDAGERFQRSLARRVARPLAVAGVVRTAAEHPVSANVMLALARIAPALVAWTAGATRIGDIAH